MKKVLIKKARSQENTLENENSIQNIYMCKNNEYKDFEVYY